MSVPKLMAASLLALVLVTVAGAVPPVPPVEKHYWPQWPGQADVVTATFLGGKGTEWLVGGGWQPDGSVVLVGDVLGPTFELGAPVTVIGVDSPPPAEPGPLTVALGDRGKPMPVWNLPGVTGFLVKCSPDIGQVWQAFRLPWMSGTITAAVVDQAGAVYIAGMAGDTIARLGGRQEAATVTVPDIEAPVSVRTFVAKIAPDLSRCEWLWQLQGPSDAPQLRLLKDGTLWLVAQDVRTLDSTGKVLSAMVVPGGLGTARAVSPVDDAIAKNTNRLNWSTGREPWKAPGIRIARPDGSDITQAYEWDGHYVGLDNHRSVADTHVMSHIYDDEGNLLLFTWSDGGNTVMRYASHDIRRSPGCPTLPFNRGMTGYNVVKLDGREYNTVATTKWQCEGGGGLTRLHALVPLPGGMVCIGGTMGPHGVQETANSLLPQASAQGNFVTILSPNLASLVFSTLVGGAGEANTTGRGAWGVISGQVQGQRKILLLTGAKDRNEPVVHAQNVYETPTRRAVQPTFGGGALDGYAILLDVPTIDGTAVQPAVSTRFDRLGLEAVARPVRPDRPAPITLPAEGTPYYFLSDYPKFVTADAEFRDATDTWAVHEPMQGEKPWSAPVVRSGVSVSVHAVRPVYGQGETMAFEVALTNTTATAVRLPAMGWKVQLLQGWQIWWQAAGPVDALPAMILAPGAREVVTVTVAPRMLLALALVGPAGAGKPAASLPYGTYSATVRLVSADTTEIASSPVAVRIAPYWPNFMYGQSVSGEMVWKDGKLTGNATVSCPAWVQTTGEQHRRVLGELVEGKAVDTWPAVTFTLHDMGPLKLLEIKEVDARGTPVTRVVQYFEAKGTLTFAGKTLEVPARCVPRFSTTMPDAGKPGVGIDAYFTVKGRDLGLTRLLDEQVDIRIGMRGTLTKSDPPAAPAAGR